VSDSGLLCEVGMGGGVGGGGVGGVGGGVEVREGGSERRTERTRVGQGVGEIYSKHTRRVMGTESNTARERARVCERRG
jgi:hypothetical protein